MRSILGPEAGVRLKPIWGLDPEGEICGAWRDLGIPRAWYMIGNVFCATKETRAESKAGNFALCRFHSKHLALRTFSGFPMSMLWRSVNEGTICPTEIKAIEEGLFDEKRYSLETP